MSIDELKRDVRAATDERARRWLDDAVAAVQSDPTKIRVLFPAVGREVGRGPLRPDEDASDLFTWTVDDAARVLLLHALGDRVREELPELYRFGDAAERRAVLRGLPLLPVGSAGEPLVDDAIRTNDLRLIAAALSPYTLEHADDHWVEQAALKCVFVGIPLDRIEGLAERTTPEMSRMLAGFAHERVAAGRQVPPDIWPFVDRYPPEEELAAISAELEHDVPERRRAAEDALEARRAARQAPSEL